MRVLTEVLPPPCSTRLRIAAEQPGAVDAQREIVRHALAGVAIDRRARFAVDPTALHRPLPSGIAPESPAGRCPAGPGLFLAEHALRPPAGAAWTIFFGGRRHDHGSRRGGAAEQRAGASAASRQMPPSVPARGPSSAGAATSGSDHRRFGGWGRSRLRLVAIARPQPRGSRRPRAHRPALAPHRLEPAVPLRRVLGRFGREGRRSPSRVPARIHRYGRSRHPRPARRRGRDDCAGRPGVHAAGGGVRRSPFASLPGSAASAVSATASPPSALGLVRAFVISDRSDRMFGRRLVRRLRALVAPFAAAAPAATPPLAAVAVLAFRPFLGVSRFGLAFALGDLVVPVVVLGLVVGRLVVRGAGFSPPRPRRRRRPRLPRLRPRPRAPAAPARAPARGCAPARPSRSRTTPARRWCDRR